MTISQISSTFDALELVAHLKNFRRDQIVVVITPTQDGDLPFDPAMIDAECGDRASIYVVTDPDLTFVLTDELTSQLSVFGGAARLYPRGIAWLDDMLLAPLFIAYDREAALRKQPALIEKVFRMSNTAARRPLHADITITPPITPAPTPREAMDPKPVEVAPAPEKVEEAPSAEVSVDAAGPADVISKRDATIQQRDQTIAERDRTIVSLNQDLYEERERLSAIAEMLVSAQRDHAATIRRGHTNEIRSRELLVENAEMKRKLAEAGERNREQATANRKKVTTSTIASRYRPELFTSREDAVRFAVLQMWVERIPAAAKADHPLPEYGVGPRFAESLEEFDRATQEKALKCIVDVLTNMAKNLSSRSVHPLRLNQSTPAGSRADGATCFRAYIESNTASARRLHYWKLPDGSLELSRVVLHDDYAA